MASGASSLNTFFELRHGSGRGPVLAGLDRLALAKERDQAVENAGRGGDGFQD
jgi:hypothetical protein